MIPSCLTCEFCNECSTLTHAQFTRIHGHILFSFSHDSLCSEWSDLSVDTPTSELGFHKSSSSLSVLSDASTFLPSLPPDSISTISNTRIGEPTPSTGKELIFSIEILKRSEAHALTRCAWVNTWPFIDPIFTLFSFSCVYPTFVLFQLNFCHEDSLRFLEISLCSNTHLSALGGQPVLLLLRWP